MPIHKKEIIKMAQTRSMTSVKRTRDMTVAAAPTQHRKVRAVAAAPSREPYQLRPRAKTTIVVSIPQTPYNLRPRIHVA